MQFRHAGGNNNSSSSRRSSPRSATKRPCGRGSGGAAGPPPQGSRRGPRRDRETEAAPRGPVPNTYDPVPPAFLGREWLRSHPFPFFQPPSSPSGRGLPLPRPLPLDLDGGFARWQRALFGPRWLQEGLREPKIASKIAQESPTWLKIAHNMPPRGSNTAPKRLQVAKEPPEEAPERPTSIKSQRKLNVFVCLLIFSLPMGF